MPSISDDASDASSLPSKMTAKSDNDVSTVATTVAEEEMIIGSSLVQFCCLLLLFAGVGELICGSLVISLTNGRYVGGVYVGIAAMFAGLRGLFLKHGIASVIGTLIFSTLALIISLVGTVLQARMFSFVTSLQACATNAVVPTTQCNTASSVYYTCLGATEAFNAAYVCARDSYTYSTNTNTANNDDYSSPGAILCGCVTSSVANPLYSSVANTPSDTTDDYLHTDDFTANNANSLATSVNGDTCHAFREFDDCDTILTQVPHYLQVAYVFGVACVLLATLVSLVCLLLWVRPRWFQIRCWPFRKSTPAKSETRDTNSSKNNNNDKTKAI